jgi:hypothetical protein
MSLVVHPPEAEMGGKSSDNDRTTRWVTFHFDSEVDADAAHKLLEEALKRP